MLNRQQKWRCYKNSNLPVNPESHTHSLVLLSQYPLTHSVIQVWISQLGPVHPAWQTHSSFESQWPWKLHLAEQSLVMLKREIRWENWWHLKHTAKSMQPWYQPPARRERAQVLTHHTSETDKTWRGKKQGTLLAAPPHSTSSTSKS